MPTPTLISLSNEAYDDYVGQYLSRLERQADMIRHLATEEINRSTSDPYYDHATAARPHNNRPRRPVSAVGNGAYRPTPHNRGNIAERRRLSFDNTRSDQEGLQTRHRGYPHRAEEEYHYEDPEISQRRRQRERGSRNRRPRSASVGTCSTGYKGNRDETVEDDDVEESNEEDEEDREMRKRAIITRRNTKRNQRIPVITDMPLDQSGIQPSEPTMHNVPPVQPGLHTQQQAPPPQSRESIPLPQPSQLPPGQQQQQPGEQPLHQSPVQPQPAVGAPEEHRLMSASTTPNLSTGTATSSSTGTASPVKKKKWPWSLFNITAAAITSSRKQDHRRLSPMPVTTMSTPIQESRGTIWPVNTTGPRGDTLSPEQQEEIVRQLPGNSFIPAAQENNANEFTKITGLSYIWVFRAENIASAHYSGVDVWNNFDYHNQKLLTQHYYQHSETFKLQPQNDGGIELFDSHICDGRLPVLVFPFRQEAFYATDFTGNHIIKLQVSWLPNSKDVQFVYRRQQY